MHGPIVQAVARHQVREWLAVDADALANCTRQGFVRIRLAIDARPRQIGQIEVLRLLGLRMKQELTGDGWNVGAALSRAEAAAAVAIYAGRLCPLHVQATLAFTAQRLTGGEITES